MVSQFINGQSSSPSATDVDSNTTHRSSDGTDHSDVVSNTTHSSADGKDHSDVVLNNTHRTSDGSDHSFIDQDVTITGTPIFLQVDADNLRLDGNTISSTDTDGDISLLPDRYGRAILGPVIIIAGTEEWTDRVASSPNRSFTGLTTGNGLFVTVAATSLGTDLAMFSSDGINWTSGTTPGESDGGNWVNVAYGAGLFVAVSQSGTPDKIMTSPDGNTWTRRVPSTAIAWKAIAFGNGVFVTLGFNSQCMTSPDGINWTTRTIQNKRWRAVTFATGLFVAVNDDGVTENVSTSPDGITWTARTTPQDSNWNEVVYGNGTFVSVSQDGTERVMTSPDGITWTLRTASVVHVWSGLGFGDGLFVALSTDSSEYMTSTDGIVWTTRTSSSDGNWQDVEFLDGIFVAIGQAGSRVMSSGTQQKNILRDFDAQDGFTIDGKIVIPSNLVVVAEASDFPSTLAANTTYKIVAPITIETGGEITIPNAGGIEIESTHRTANTITYNGTGTLFTSAAVTGSFGLSHINIIGNTVGTLFALTGSNGSFTASCRFLEVNFNSWGSLGAIASYESGIVFEHGGALNSEAGLTVTDTFFIGFHDLFFSNSSTMNDNFLDVGSDVSRVAISNSGFQCQAGENALLVNSSFTGELILSTIFAIPAGQLFDSGGLDGTSIYVDVNSVANQKDSESIGSFVVPGNTTTTTLVTDTWTDLDLGANAVAGSNLEGWTLTSTTTGELRYDGLGPFSGMATANLVVEPNGSKRYNFRILKNGSVLPQASTASLAISGTVGTVTFVAPVTAVTTDLFRMQIIEIDGSDSPLISDMTLSIQ